MGHVSQLPLRREVRDIEALRQIREHQGFTQAELARRMGIDPSILRHVEAGRREPYPKFMKMASAILGVQERVLFGGEDAADN